LSFRIPAEIVNLEGLPTSEKRNLHSKRPVCACCY